MKIDALRSSIVDALRAASLPASTFASPPSSLQPPMVAVVPADPYLDPVTIGDALHLDVNLRVTIAVSRSDGASELDELETIATEAMLAMPVGATVGALSRPSRVPLDEDGTRFGLLAYFETTINTNPFA